MSATITQASPCHFIAELEGERLGTFATLDEAKAAITARMKSRYGLIPA